MTDRAAHKRAVRRAFDRAAGSYDGAAGVQREICARLAGFAAMWPAQRPVARILDAGCGTGYGLPLLATRFAAAHCVALDFAPAMLARLGPAAGADLLCADVEALPLADASIDLVWSSLALQWCDPGLALAELARVLRPGGRAWIATLGPRTLWELREAFRLVDSAEHVIAFHARDGWQAAATRAGLVTLACEQADAFALGPDLRSLLRDIKAIGAHSVGAARRRRPLGRSAWRALEAHYERHRRHDARLPATYDVIYLALAKP